MTITFWSLTGLILLLVVAGGLLIWLFAKIRESFAIRQERRAVSHQANGPHVNDPTAQTQRVRSSRGTDPGAAATHNAHQDNPGWAKWAAIAGVCAALVVVSVGATVLVMNNGDGNGEQQAEPAPADPDAPAEPAPADPEDEESGDRDESDEPSGSDPPVASTVVNDSNVDPVREAINSSVALAQSRGYRTGDETTGGVDCVDGCVLFNGIPGNGAAGKMESFGALLTQSHRASRFTAQQVHAFYGTSPEANPALDANSQHDADLVTTFGYFNGADVSLGVMKKGTTIYNSTIENGEIVQFAYTLPRDREYLSIRKDGHELIVFTSCGNGVTVTPTPGVPQRPTPPPTLREFVPPMVPPTTPPGDDRPPPDDDRPPPDDDDRPPPDDDDDQPPPDDDDDQPKCFDENGTPVFEGEFCADPDEGAEQQPVQDNDPEHVAPTPGYPGPGHAEEIVADQDEAGDCIASGECDEHEPTDNGVEVPDSEDGGGAPGGDVDDPDEQDGSVDDGDPNAGEPNPDNDTPHTENPDDGTSDPEDTEVSDDDETPPGSDPGMP